MCDDDWVKLAMANDSIVADILLRLHRPLPPRYLNLRWAVRHPRSRSIPKQAAKPMSTRASPTTPLSWSGATSASAGGAVDGYEESSRINKLVETSRSKVANLRETVITKKSRKKKTLAELKEEESRLLTERRNLKSELASLRLTVEEQRATNESLKRMKLDLESRQNIKTGTASEVPGKIIYNSLQFVEAECLPSNSISPKTVTHKVPADDSHVHHASSKAQEIGNHESPFVLPDLNLPVEEDLSSNAVCIVLATRGSDNLQ